MSARGAVFHVASSANCRTRFHKSREPLFSIHCSRHLWRAPMVQFRRATDRTTAARSKGIAQRRRARETTEDRGAKRRPKEALEPEKLLQQHILATTSFTLKVHALTSKSDNSQSTWFCTSMGTCSNRGLVWGVIQRCGVQENTKSCCSG